MKKVVSISLSILGIACFFILLGIKLFGVESYVVASDSMAPTIRVNAIVYAKKAKQSDIEIGDIIVVKTGITPNLHRVVEMTEESVTTKGDNNDNNDASVSWDKVEGKMLYQIPLLGIFARSIYPWLIVFLLGGITYIALRLFKELVKK